MMTLSQLDLEDVEALCLGPSFLMADPMGPLLDHDEEEALSPSSSLEGEVPASPPLSLSPYPTLLLPLFPPLDHARSLLEVKGGALPWLGAGDLLDAHVGADNNKDDAFTGMDWMTEKIDLDDFDLESLIGSCSSEESPRSPGDLLASLHSHMDLDVDSFDPPASNNHPESEMPNEPTQEEAGLAQQVVMKSEPCSPLPPLSPCPPPSPTSDTRDEADTNSPLAIIPDPSGGSPIVVVLANEDTPPLVSLHESTVESSPPSSDCDSDSGIESVAGSPTCVAGSSRTKPYTKSEPSSPRGKVKSASGPPKEKKMKKMEQNKTAATRYRQKKRVEQELLGTECEELERKNQVLAEKAESISKEIQYLKDLMEEVRKRHRRKVTPPTT
ncbi:cyclic AMP-dependent transcription factor ATF-4 [Entelurus aequoreus]|uniref:cyclic AMP-dependent transcription factor ATF-4 n=1 Tax=Entelurus aequoreus TaxID=161455 RepID=UPI002B1CF868|nr:cyclic AMP-dependent transcription factor ATF-4 [Entelurus aequoreus]